jgi:hypothetical protein
VSLVVGGELTGFVECFTFDAYLCNEFTEEVVNQLDKVLQHFSAEEHPKV